MMGSKQESHNGLNLLQDGLVLHSYIPSIQRLRHEFKTKLSEAVNSEPACEMKERDEGSKKERKANREKENKILGKVFINKNLLLFIRQDHRRN